MVNVKTHNVCSMCPEWAASVFHRIECKYRIYSIKRPTSNKRPPRISAHPEGRKSAQPECLFSFFFLDIQPKFDCQRPYPFCTGTSCLSSFIHISASFEFNQFFYPPTTPSATCTYFACLCRIPFCQGKILPPIS